MIDKTPELSVAQRRKYLRFPADPMDSALIDPTDQGEFMPKYVALISQEAYGGCGVLLDYRAGIDKVFTEGMICRIKAGKLDPMKAQVAWIRRIEEEALRIGFKFLD